MVSKTVIVTGANSGLGFECVKEIAKSKEDWHIVLACRNKEKGEQAKHKINTQTDYANLSVLVLDLASFDSIHQFVKTFRTSNFPPLKGLINNAGMQVQNGLHFTEDGYEITFATNHLGHFLLTNLLLNDFKESSRIIVVSSGLHDPESVEGKYNKVQYLGAKKLATPKGENEMTGMQRYSTSKLANLLFSYKLATLVQDSNIMVNAFDPGAVPDTNLISSIKNPLIRYAIRRSSWLFKLMGVKVSTPKQSGQAMARLLLDNNLQNVSGKYFQIFQQKTSSKQSYNKKLQDELWNDSLKLVELI